MMRRITMKKMFFGGDDESPSAKVSDDLPAKLKTLQRSAELALKSVRGANPDRLSAQERAEDEDLATMVRALADPKKTAAVYFEMFEAASRPAGGPPSEPELVAAREICEGLSRELLTDEERQAIERLARKHK
jgi:hypothetical protein